VRAQAGIRLLRDEPTHLISGMLVDHVPEWPQEDIAIATKAMCISLFSRRVDGNSLRGHRKTGQRWSLQNRPTKVAWD
jgi:hypothetical protein